MNECEKARVSSAMKNGDELSFSGLRARPANVFMDMVKNNP